MRDSKRMGRRTVLRTAVGAAVVTLLAGCSWFGGDKPRYVPAPLTEFAPSLTARTVWSAGTGGEAGLGFQPVVVDGAVYAAAKNGTVGKYELASGRQVWRGDADTRLAAGVGSDGVTTAVSNTRGEIIAFDDTGKIKWRAQATSEVTIPPVVANNMVIVRSSDYRIQAFDASNGQRRWSVQRPGPALSLRSVGEMLVSGGYVFTGLPGGKVIAVSLDSGAVRWEGTVAVPRGTSELERVADVVGAPVISGRTLCAVTYQGRIGCFDVGSGQSTWARDFSGVSGIAADVRFAFAPSDRSVVSGFAIDTGANVWRQDALQHRSLSAPVSVGRAVALGDYQGYVHFLGREDGRLLARVATDGSAIVTRPLATPQGIVLQTSRGTLALVGVGE